DEGLVIQELSRPEELEKLQHELAKQVSKLAELGELKWLEQLEKLETEELQRVKDRIGEIEAKKLEEVIEKELKEWEEQSKALAELKEIKPEALKEVQTTLGKQGKTKLAEKIKELAEMEKAKVEKLNVLVKEELAAIRGLKELALGLEELKKELEALKGLKGQEALKKLGELAEKATKLRDLDKLEERKLEEVKKKVKGSELAEHLDKTWLLRRIGRVGQELAAIRGLKELGLEERLRVLAEIKEVRALAEKRKAGGLEIQEGLQLTEKIKALNVGIVGGLGRLEAKRLGEADGRLVEKLERLGRLDELVPGKTLGEMKATLKQLKEIKLREVKAEIEAQKSAKFKEKNLVAQSVGIFGTIFGLVERTVTGRETLGNVLKIQDVAKLENLQAKLKEATEKKGGLNALEELEKIKGLKVEKLAEGLKALAKIKALEELTEIAEKRGVATTLKAALASAMEMAKNRGWTDYLNSLDVSERANAARELIAAEKIRKWARDINNLD
ncbi:coiled-coil domain-containing protein, partial [Anaplasma marginale]